VGYNYLEFRYPEDHQKYPNRVIYGSENGMGREAWAAVDSNAYISAQYLWTGADYLGEAGKWPERSNGAGLLDMASFPKPEYYFRQSLWSDKPMVYLAAAEAPKEGNPASRGHRRMLPTWNWPAGTPVRVTGFSNAETTELFLNGQSLGRKQGREVYWDVPYQPGELLAKGYHNGQEVSRHVLKTTDAPAAIQATAYPSTAKAPGLAQIEVRIVDKNGNPVVAAINEVTVTVTGPAKVLGLESGDPASHENYQAPKRLAYHGQLLVYVQTQGPVTVTLQAPGLTSKTLALDAAQ
jgi:beta-galactosidase